MIITSTPGHLVFFCYIDHTALVFFHLEEKIGLLRVEAGERLELVEAEVPDDVGHEHELELDGHGVVVWKSDRKTW
jgi:hypothetical protein